MRKKLRLDYDQFSQLITQNFPPVKLAFGYGSAFFPQKNYDYDKNRPILDVIFVVEERHEWHKENMKANRKHYGGLSYVFGSGFVNMVQNTLCPIHYNPFIQLNEHKIKYGVISEKDFKRDLLGWETLIVSGRMHKPIRKLVENEDYSPIIQRNLQTAVAAALLLDGRTAIRDKELFFNIASLSYLGDIRFTLKGENKDKIANIVEGQYDHLVELYQPILTSQPFKDIIKIQESTFLFPKYTPEGKFKLVSLLPDGFGSEYVGENKDFKQTLLLRTDDQREVLKDAIADLNAKNSKSMLIYHLLTVSPLKNFKYGLQKLKKGFSK